MAWVGFAMVSVFMLLILTRRLSAIVALILVPVAFGLALGLGPELGKMIMDGVLKVTPTAMMLMFALLYFAVMFDAGLFEPAVKRIIRWVGDDPLRITLGTAALATIISLDGDGATTVLVVVTAFLPVYLRLGMNPLILAVMLLLTNTVINIVPWGGPTARAASALHVDALEVFLGLIPAMLAGLAYAFAAAWWLGKRERRRLGWVAGQALAAEPAREREAKASHRPRLFWVNLALTLALVASMGLGIAPLPVLMMVGLALAMVINYPRLADQRERVAAHAENVLNVVALIFAAGAFTGILSGSGMVDGMSQAFLNVVPEGSGPYMSLITALAAIPFTFVMSNDAFFFGILPILNGAAGQYGVDPLHIARASVLGQPVHALSPLIAAPYLLVGLLKRDMGELQRHCLGWALGSSAVLILAALATGAIL
ncbi:MULTISPECIES: citrate:proton symporter [unclassified Pseudomonas]|uniref:CitMHS family transporter n=1 Tax=unclassified Pseudomonas TaxID=196821 RepID=UPI00244CC22C|nr:MULTISPECIES: citrate:proton symporter [unclassified Pseudomonas]MDG9927596.1 citrate:proton symporter [Pseudomonas sp. GD04042]MDH0485254.1 citrate:proton symporter [Pseudomonas sp. GD04015]MDH0603827.1 citrate:proton symporter [Pseudomonas sp. GD03869]